jgi:hypothetical protein
MGRLSNLRHVDPVLTELAQGYSNAEMIADALFPFVNVTKEAGKIPEHSKEAFRIYGTERGLRADSNVLSPEDRTDIDYALTEHDIAYPIDYREEEEDIFDTQAHATHVSTSAIMLRHEKIAADIAQASANYPSGHKTALSGSSRWDQSASTPIDDIKTGRNAIRAAIAKYPNTLVLGATAFETLQEHASIIERIKYSNIGVVTIDLLKQVLNIPRIFVGQGVYSADGSSFTDLWGDAAILAYVPVPAGGRDLTVYDPSFGYTLRKKGRPDTDTYMGTGNKVEYVRTTDNFVVKLTGASAGYLIEDVNT